MTARAEVPQPVQEQAQVQAQNTVRTQEDFNPTQNTKMLEMLHNQPEIRPEVLAKAQQMVADPNYPPTNVIANLAKMFVNNAN